jgi:hypothetical protein
MCKMQAHRWMAREHPNGAAGASSGDARSGELYEERLPAAAMALT